MPSTFDLESHHVKGYEVSDVYYVPNFITEAEEDYLIRQVRHSNPRNAATLYDAMS